VAKAVSEVPCGGQIVASSDTIAAIGSMDGLMQQVASHPCKVSFTASTFFLYSNVPALSANSYCFAVTPCGRLGQRAVLRVAVQ
jgi:hypothetical protein